MVGNYTFDPRKSNSHERNIIFKVLNGCNTLVPFNHSHTLLPRQRYLRNITFRCTKIFILTKKLSIFWYVPCVDRKCCNLIHKRTKSIKDHSVLCMIYFIQNVILHLYVTPTYRVCIIMACLKSRIYYHYWH